MHYVARALHDLNSSIITFEKQVTKDREEFESQKKSYGDFMSDEDLGIALVKLQEQDLYKLKSFQNLLKSGDLKSALNYSNQFMETSVRDMIPASTYEFIGGKLLHQKDMSFKSDEVINDSYYALTSKILKSYATGNAEQAKKDEEVLNKKIDPHKIGKASPSEPTSILNQCLKHLETMDDSTSKELVKKIKKSKPNV